jgi:hypothetical protein
LLDSAWMRRHRPDFLYNRTARDFIEGVKERMPQNSDLAPLRAAAWVQNLRWGAQFAKILGARFHVVLQPLGGLKRKKAGGETNLGDDFQPIRDLVTAFRAEANRFSAEFEFTDMSDKYSDREEVVFRDAVHLVDEPLRHREIAAALAEIVKRQMAKPKIRPALSQLSPESRFVF